ncbi:MAG: efflux RND transporter periplasmic adaptor subunit [Acidobacteriia bacterium]|nr:efflux RND transporter periplasmic adaptor subunit [Terriglobia bacterium]
MKISRFFIFLGVVFVVALVGYLVSVPHGTEIPLTGVLDSNDVIVSAKITGRIERLLVDEGSEVQAGQLLAELDTAELIAQRDSAAAAIRSFQAQVRQAQATQGLTDEQTAAQVSQAAATLTAVKAQLEASRSDLLRNELDQKRVQGLFAGGIATAQDKDHADAALRSAQANVRALEDQVKAQEAALELARANRKQVSVQRSVLAAMQAQLAQAVAAKSEAETRLGYTKIYAPLGGIVSVRVARQGEVVQPGAPIVTIVDIDHLWVRASVEESYIDVVQFGQKLRVRLPSGEVIEGTLIFKGVESEFATQRDVSRTKRDIKTFAIKVAVPNPGRRLFAGMTATVLLPPPGKGQILPRRP